MSTLVLTLACHFLGTKPLPEQILAHFNRTIEVGNRFLCNSNLITTIFIRENEWENVAHTKAAILSQFVYHISAKCIDRVVDPPCGHLGPGTHFTNDFSITIQISMEISFSCNPIVGNHIAAVVSCAKFCSDHFIKIWMRVKLSFHRIWIVMKFFLVKRVPGGQDFGRRLWSLHNSINSLIPGRSGSNFTHQAITWVILAQIYVAI